MIIASVVLPRPGGPRQQHVVGRAPAPPRRLEHEAELLAHPLLADELVERPRPQRRLDGALVARRPSALDQAVARSALVGHRARSCAAQRAQRGAQQHGDVGLAPAARASSASGDTARRHRRPRGPTSRARAAPTCTWSRQPRVGRHGADRPATATPGRRAEPVLELEHDALGALAADAGHQHQRDRGPRWRPRAAARRGRARRASPARAAGRRRSRSAAARRPRARRRRRSRTASASPRGRSATVAQLRRLAERSPASVPGVHCTASPTPPTSTTAASGASAATRPATKAIIGRPPRRCCGRRPRPAGPGPRRARRGRSPAPSASAASAGLGVASSRSSRVTIAADLRLVGPAAAGDRGLDLARRVQRDRAGRVARPRRSRPRWPGRCP